MVAKRKKNSDTFIRKNKLSLYREEVARNNARILVQEGSRADISSLKSKGGNISIELFLVNNTVPELRLKIRYFGKILRLPKKKKKKRIKTCERVFEILTEIR